MIPLQLNSKMAPDVCWVLGVEESGVSVVLEDVVEEEKELEDDERKDVLEEGVGVDGAERGEIRIDRRRVSFPIRGG